MTCTKVVVELSFRFWLQRHGQHNHQLCQSPTITMSMISPPINGGHNEVGGDWVLPQVLIPHVTKSSHHLVLPPVIKCQVKVWTFCCCRLKPTWDGRLCTGWHAPSRVLLPPPCCWQALRRCSIRHTWSPSWWEVRENKEKTMMMRRT